VIRAGAPRQLAKKGIADRGMRVGFGRRLVKLGASFEREDSGVSHLPSVRVQETIVI